MKEQHDQRKGDVRSIWLRPHRGPRDEPPLSRARIVETAVTLLDEEGIERLTMRRLAERLGVAAPSLYGHVDTKDDVIDLAVDAIFAGAQLGHGQPSHWRDDVVTVMSAWRGALLRHPWAAAVPARRRPTIGPNFLAWMEFLQATLVGAGFTGTRLSAATWVLYNHVMGSTASQTALKITDDERRIGQQKLLAEREQYPTLAANGYLYDDDWDGSFTTGLRYLLDGLAAQQPAT